MSELDVVMYSGELLDEIIDKIYEKEMSDEQRYDLIEIIIEGLKEQQ